MVGFPHEMLNAGEQGRYHALMLRRGALAILLVAIAAPLITNATSSCPTLSRNLSRGLTGADVSALQQFLIGQGVLAADSATGFDGLTPSGYFGPKTEQAVQAFQRAQGLVSSGTALTTGFGFVGTKTRAAIGKLCTTNVAPAAIKAHVVPKLRNLNCQAVALPIGKSCNGKWQEVKAANGCTPSCQCTK